MDERRRGSSRVVAVGRAGGIGRAVRGLAPTSAVTWNVPLRRRSSTGMREAGIAHVRTDFDWGMVHRRQDASWSFGHLDELMETAARKKMNILPILDYAVPWAVPRLATP